MKTLNRYDPIPDCVNVSKGDVQCRIVEFDRYESGSYMCCARKDGHEGPHINAYGYELDERRIGPCPSRFVDEEDGDEAEEQLAKIRSTGHEIMTELADRLKRFPDMFGNEAEQAKYRAFVEAFFKV